MKIFIVALLYSNFSFSYYGVDNRMEYHETKEEELKEIAKAMAFQTYRDDSYGWDFNRLWQMKSMTLEQRGVCSEERFIEQPTFSRETCSAVLISPKHLLTAGNCLTEHYCKNDLFYWMFNYHLESESPFSLKRPRKDYYQCKNILKRVYDPNSFNSFAIIELKKEVEGVRPVTISKTPLQKGDELIVMGHSFGMPLKIAFDAEVIKDHDKFVFVNSDIAGNNHGSILLNAKTLELEGILINGRKDYSPSENGCHASERLYKDEAREVGLKMTQIYKFLETIGL